ncbi:polar amino acid transport system substrate-binding protein [Kitasatospora sp. MAA4]|uniref:ABC transporter substrate-binding protein n=1 Tax=Kitasatospora sp. MAA4 TaxID=3035093 RepID=UPI0024737E23|nr:ABC transporter substrate-binding protein [Kitasatospora sp. MAA4]MDH6133008.1 polar amino acid transport system substrate-binding protein [Kitasatospora sp. MAA4]
MPYSPFSVPVPPVLAVGLGSLLLAGCGSTAASTTNPGAALRAQLPKAIKSAGVLRIGSNLNYAPVDFEDQNATPVGLDPDLAAALGSYLGLKVQFDNMPFDKLIPAVQSGQIDLAMSAVIDTQQRQTGADDNGHQVNPGVDFVDYFETGSTLLVKAGNPAGISTLDNLCGHTVALQSGTIQAQIVARQQTACARSNRPLKVDLFDTDGQALAEVANGTAVADLNDYPVAAYTTDPSRNGGQFQVTGSLLQPSPYGITVAKTDPTLRDVLSSALNQLIRNGSYDKLLTKWDMHDGAIPDAQVNGGF